MGGGRGEQVAPVEGAAHDGQPEVRLGQLEGAPALALQERREEPVVGPDEDLPARGQGQPAARGADAGVDHGEMHGARREERRRGLQRQRALGDVVALDLVGHVDELQRLPGGLGDAEHHALHLRDVGIAEPEVSGQRDDPGHK